MGGVGGSRQAAAAATGYVGRRLRRMRRMRRAPAVGRSMAGRCSADEEEVSREEMGGMAEDALTVGFE